MILASLSIMEGTLGENESCHPPPAEGKPQIGTWLSLGSISAAVHGPHRVSLAHARPGTASPTDMGTAATIFGAIADAGCVPLARVPTGKHEWIKMVLDSGAMGIVAPMVMDAAEARAIVSATKYAPRGNRSVGADFMPSTTVPRPRSITVRRRRDPGRDPDRAHPGRRDRR